MKTLASIASVQPQATYAAPTKSLQSEWLFPLESFPIVDLIWKTRFHHVFCHFYVVWSSLLLRDNCFPYLYSLVSLVFSLQWLCLVIMSGNCYDPS